MESKFSISASDRSNTELLWSRRNKPCPFWQALNGGGWHEGNTLVIGMEHQCSTCHLKPSHPSLTTTIVLCTLQKRILFFFLFRWIFLCFFQLQEGGTFSTSISLQTKSQRWEVLSLFTIQWNLQFARANINNRHGGGSAYKIWIQGSAIMRSAFVHCVGKISPPNNSFIHPYRFLKCSLLRGHHWPATQQQAGGLNFHSCIIFDSPCKVCSPVSW